MNKTLIFILLIFAKNISANSWFTLVSLQDFVKKHPEVQQIPCSEELFFEYNSFPLSINQASHPNFGNFEKTYILNIPHAQIQSRYGFVTYQDQFIEEFMWKKISYHLRLLQPIPQDKIIPISGKVAVISQLAYFNYWHWLSEVLCRLALLEMQNIEYDYLYVNQDSKFMRDSLKLWGIPTEKIITPTSDDFFVQADEVILPSLVSNVNFGFAEFSCYVQKHLLKYVREKLLAAALAHESSINFSKRIFISRKDSHIRNIINEDDFFKTLEPYGFERYELGKLSIIDQIHLFNQAEFIISPQGTGLANSIFCNPQVRIVELFQGLNDTTFWYLSQDLKFNYMGIQTTNFIEDYVAAWQTPTIMPTEIIDILKPLIAQ